MGNSSTYPVFFKCYNLHPDQEKEIENYFHTWTSSGRSCESLKRESKYVYSFAFRNKKDQQAVLRKAKHIVNLTDGCSLTFTVQSSLKAANSPSTVTPTSIQQHSTPFSISPASPTGENCEQDVHGLIAKIIVLSMLGLHRINPEETRNLVKRYWKSKADNNHEVLTSQHKRSNNNDKACQTMDQVEHRQSGINDSGLSQKMPFINSNKGDLAVAYNLKNGLQMMVCLGDITRLDTDTLMTIPVDDLDHSNGASFLSEAFRSKSLIMPFYSSGPFGVPLSICTEAIVNAVRQYSSQGGRMVSRIILIDKRNHVVKGMLEVCDNLFQGISHGCRSFSGGRFQMDPAEEDTVRTSDEGVAEVAGDSVHVEVVMGTIETQQVDAVVSPMVGHNPLSSGLGRTLNEIVGPQLMSRFRNTAGNESVPGDSVLLKGLPRLPSGAVFFLNLIPWDDDDDGTAVQVLRLGINSILTSCKRQGFESISLPVLGVGIALRFPESLVAKVLREEIQSFEWSQDRSKPLLVRIVLQPNITSTQCCRSIEVQLQELLTTLDNTAKKAKEGYGKCISVNAWIKLTDNTDRSGSNAFFGSSLVVLQVAEKSVNIDGKGEDDAKENEATTSGQAQRGGSSKGREFGGIWYPVLGSIGAVIGATGTFSSGAAGIGGAGMRATGGGGTGGGGTGEGGTGRATGGGDTGGGGTGGSTGGGGTGGATGVGDTGGGTGGSTGGGGSGGPTGGGGSGGATGGGRGSGGATGGGGTSGATGGGGTGGATRGGGSGGATRGGGTGGATRGGGTGGATGGGDTGGAQVVAEATEGFIAAEATAAITGTSVTWEHILTSLGIMAPGGLYALKKFIEIIVWVVKIISQIKKHIREILLATVFYLLLMISLILSVNVETILSFVALFLFSLLVLLILLIHDNNTKQNHVQPVK